MTNNSFADFALAQSEMKTAELNKVNPHFKSKYADLAAVRAATLPALNKYGFSVIQNPTLHDGKLILITQIIHKTGDIIARSEYPLSMGLAPQKIGSEITYARRYAWSSICGICADEDDDGNNAEHKKPDTQDFWKGPLNKTALKQVMRDLASELNKISAKDTEQFLEGLWVDNKAALVQAAIDLPDWYDAAGKGKRKALGIINIFPGDMPEGRDPAEQSPFDSASTGLAVQEDSNE